MLVLCIPASLEKSQQWQRKLNACVLIIKLLDKERFTFLILAVTRIAKIFLSARKRKKKIHFLHSSNTDRSTGFIARLIDATVCNDSALGPVNTGLQYPSTAERQGGGRTLIKQSAPRPAWPMGIQCLEHRGAATAIDAVPCPQLRL